MIKSVKQRVIIIGLASAVILSGCTIGNDSNNQKPASKENNKQTEVSYGSNEYKQEPDIKEEKRVGEIEKDKVEKREVEYVNEYNKATVTLSKDGDRYIIDYVALAHNPEFSDSFNEGPMGGEIDEDTYNRVIKILDYMDENRDEFNEKAAKYSQLNMANPDETSLMKFALSYLALSVDKSYKDDWDTCRYEAESFLSDVEQIISHEDFTDEFYAYTDIASCGDKDREGYLHEYYSSEDEKIRVVDYNTYVDTWNYYTNNAPLKYEDTDKEYAILAELGFSSWVDLWVDNMFIEDNKLNVSIYSDKNGVMADGGGAFLVIPVPKGTELGDVDIHRPAYKDDPNYEVPCDKPVIYLYNYDENVNVQLITTKDMEITHTYPKYNNGWNIKAEPDGTLIDSNNKKYKYLFWEGNSKNIWVFSEGFCIKGSETADFLEEKLKYLGLNDEEINEFIIYWLPQMEDNEYNIISFQTDEYEKIATLKVTPEPDSQLRVFMTWYPSDVKINIAEQKLNHFERSGKTLIEWGGSRIR